MGIWGALLGHTLFPGLYKSALWGSLLQNRVRPRSITGWIAAWALCGGDEVPRWPIKPKIPPIKPILNSTLIKPILNSTLIKPKPNSTLIKAIPNSTLKYCTDQAYFPLWWLAHQHQQALWGLNAGMPHQEPLRNGSQSKPGLLSRHAIGAGLTDCSTSPFPFPVKPNRGKWCWCYILWANNKHGPISVESLSSQAAKANIWFAGFQLDDYLRICWAAIWLCIVSAN